MPRVFRTSKQNAAVISGHNVVNVFHSDGYIEEENVGVWRLVNRGTTDWRMIAWKRNR